MRRAGSKRSARAPAADPPAPPPSRRRRLDSGRRDLHAHHDAPCPWSAGRRDWASLPRDVLRVILSLLPQADILRGAGLVCASWRRVTLEDDPLLWRCIDLAELAADKGEGEDGDPPAAAGWRATARAAVRCSAGRCESFRGPIDSRFLLFLAQSAPSLRSLDVTCQYHIHKEDLVASVAKKLPLLEEVVLSRGLFEQKSLVALVSHCPRLQLFHAGGCFTYSSYGDALRAWLESMVKDLRLPHHAIWHVDHYE